VLSVFNGFEGIVKDLYSNFYTDLKITAVTGKTIILSPGQVKKIKDLSSIKNFSLVAEEKALIQNGDYQALTSLKGVDENYQYVSGVANNLTANATYSIGNEESPKLILGIGVEDALGVRADMGDNNLSVRLPRRSNSTQLNMLEDFSSDTISTSASFRIQQDFDNKYAITHIGFMKRALQFGPDEYTAVEISLKDYDDAGSTKRKLQNILGEKYLVQNKYEQNRSLYSIMTAERWVIYAVLCLILVVAGFTMIGALTMLVLEKQKDIGVLHALGGNKNFIQRIFLTEGMLLAVIGGSIGILLAFLIAQLQIHFHLIPLQGGSFLIDYYPVKLRLNDFLLVGATVFIIAILAAWLPARKAAGQQFSLRSE
jgi:lipoprotein-releasing system permease protein